MTTRQNPLRVSPLDELHQTSAFGWRTHPVDGDRRWHNGVDLRAACGTIIKAPAAGEVKSAWEDTVGGRQMVLRLASGWEVGIAHLSAHELRRGDVFGAGQTVALSGASGRVTAPHVHFVMRPPGSEQEVDPWPYLTSIGRRQGGGGGGGLLALVLLGLTAAASQ